MKNSQVNRLMNYLSSGNHCNPLIAWTKLGIYNYSARLSEVKARLSKSQVINKNTITVKNQFGEDVSFCEHWIGDK